MKYEITAEMNLGHMIAETREVAQALNKCADNLESIEKKYAKQKKEDKSVYHAYWFGNFNVKDNLHKPICEVEAASTNNMTYLEWILYVYHAIGTTLTREYMDWLMDYATNEELIEEVKKADELITK